MVSIAARRGVICFKCISSLFVYNIMMQKLIELPPIAKEWTLPQNLTNILEDCTNGSFMIVIIGRNEPNRHGVITNNGVAIYESNSRVWKISKAQLHPI